MRTTKKGTERKRAEGAGRKPVPDSERLMQVVLYVPPYLAQWLNADEYDTDPKERRKQARARKHDAVRRLKDQQAESLIA